MLQLFTHRRATGCGPSSRAKRRDPAGGWLQIESLEPRRLLAANWPHPDARPAQLARLHSVESATTHGTLPNAARPDNGRGPLAEPRHLEHGLTHLGQFGGATATPSPRTFEPLAPTRPDRARPTLEAVLHSVAWLPPDRLPTVPLSAFVVSPRPELYLVLPITATWQSSAAGCCQLVATPLVVSQPPNSRQVPLVPSIELSPLRSNAYLTQTTPTTITRDTAVNRGTAPRLPAQVPATRESAGIPGEGGTVQLSLPKTSTLTRGMSISVADDHAASRYVLETAASWGGATWAPAEPLVTPPATWSTVGLERDDDETTTRWQRYSSNSTRGRQLEWLELWDELAFDLELLSEPSRWGDAHDAVMSQWLAAGKDASRASVTTTRNPHDTDLLELPHGSCPDETEGGLVELPAQNAFTRLAAAAPTARSGLAARIVTQPLQMSGSVGVFRQLACAGGIAPRMATGAHPTGSDLAPVPSQPRTLPAELPTDSEPATTSSLTFGWLGSWAVLLPATLVISRRLWQERQAAQAEKELRGVNASLP